MAGSIMQYVLYLAVLVVLAIPLGTYMKKVMKWKENVDLKLYQVIKIKGLISQNVPQNIQQDMILKQQKQLCCQVFGR